MADVSLKKRIWGWYFFDWASQPYHTVLLTFIFGPFFVSLAQDALLAVDKGYAAPAGTGIGVAVI